jgi:hypothetical protein
MRIVRLASSVLLLLASVGVCGAFERETWQKPVVAERQGGSVEIRIDAPPAGLLLRRALDPAKRYLLKVSGRGGPMTMRLQLDDRPHEYLAAPVGSIERLVRSASRIELLFYADKPASYVLEAAALEECPSCKTSDDVRARVLAEMPQVATAKGLEKAILLMRWAANVADYTPNPKLIPAGFEGWPVEKALYEFFDRDIGGVSCGGQSVFLTRVLHLFGVEAFTISYGVPNTSLTHVTVAVPDAGKHYVVDPSFGMIFMRDGRSLDIEAALTGLAAGHDFEIVARELDLSERDVHGIFRINRNCWSYRNSKLGHGICKLGPNSLLRAYVRSEKRAWQRMGIALDSGGLVRLMRSGFFSVGRSLDPAVRQRFIDMIKARGIRFHPT